MVVKMKEKMRVREQHDEDDVLMRHSLSDASPSTASPSDASHSAASPSDTSPSNASPSNASPSAASLPNASPSIPVAMNFNRIWHE